MVIEIDELTKRYGDVSAVDGLSFSTEEGEVFGFLGPNGAGKTTTINIMLGFTRPTSGTVRLFGHDAQEASVAIRRRSGTLLEGYGVYPRLTGREHVEHAIATKNSRGDPADLLGRVGLTSAADRPAGGYSRGMRQRLTIAMALVGYPDLFVLDEPMGGLDPNGVRILRRIIRQEADRGATVFISSHVLDHIQAVADRVGILLDGQLEAIGTIDDLSEELGADTTVKVDVEHVPEDLPDRLREIEGVYEVTTGSAELIVTCSNDGSTKLTVLTTIADADVYRDFTIRDSSLEDVFAEYTADEGVSDELE